MQHDLSRKTLLLVGASRGLGFAMAEAYLARGWHVIATAREHSEARLRALADRAGGALEVERLDITVPQQVGALRERLTGRRVNPCYSSMRASLTIRARRSPTCQSTHSCR